MLITLHEIKTLIESDDHKKLKSWLANVNEDTEDWERNRFKADWDHIEDYSNIPTAGEFFAGLLGFRKRKKKDS